MAEALLVAQFASSVLIPVGIAALPAIWKEIVKIWKGMKIKSKLSDEDHTNLSIIRTTMLKLERIPDLSWPQKPNASSLLAVLQFLSKSLKTMNNKSVLLNPNKRISERIKSIAVTLQMLDNNEGLELYQKRKENLLKDLLDIIIKDNLRSPEEDSNDKWLVTTFPRIRYEFCLAREPGNSRTLTISRSVLECIEHVLRWLRDFKLGGGSIDVALYEVFTEILPQALMEHLDSRRFGPIETQQLLKNVCFLRSFSQLPTFREIQGKDGLKLDDEEKIDVDLSDDRWTTWNKLQQRIDSDNRSSTFEVAETSSRQESLTTGSASERSICPVCLIHIGDLPSYEQDVHVNVCLDTREELGYA